MKEPAGHWRSSNVTCTDSRGARVARHEPPTHSVMSVATARKHGQYDTANRGQVLTGIEAVR